MEIAPFLVGLLVIGGGLFAICFSIGRQCSGRGVLWAGGIVLGLSAAVTVHLWTRDYEAGLAGFAILLLTFLVLLPATFGALVGLGLGYLARRHQSRREAGDLQRLP